MTAGFQVHEDPVLGEEVLLATAQNGLPVRVVATDRFKEATAVVTFDYGSIDLGYRRNGNTHRSPEGVAHYLEHKLFEDEELQAFDRFAKRGARVNAMTGFANTTYFFTATDRFGENLKDLLHLVSQAHITPENVDKERGIIAQEIRMYEDSPDYRAFFDLLGCLYQEHPVRHPVGGTVESIQEITPEELLSCYDAFYRTGNAALAAAGPIDPEEVLALAEACALEPGEPAPRISAEDLGPVENARTRRQLEVARSRVLIGFKDRTLFAGDREAQLRRDLRTRILLDRLFSASSEIREDLRLRGLVDDSLGASYMSEHSFGVTVISCETDDPDRTIDTFQQLLFSPVDFNDDHLERVRRKFLGQYVRLFQNLRHTAFDHASEALDGLSPFQSMERMMSVTLDEVRARKDEHFCEDAFAVAVVEKE
ncbi:MAG: EF-P 5-aminopentanol modification-associated protein YfmH [Planctomycetota bacterium]|jgi:predicted Zn-dependent peptidase